MNDILDQCGLLIWMKDKKSRFTYCNEAFAEIAELESPKQIIGKRDGDLIWSEYAEFFQKCDYEVMMDGRIYINMLEHIKLPSEDVNILVTKTAVKNRNRGCIGVSGVAVNVTKYIQARKNSNLTYQSNRISLGPKFDNEYLTKREFLVLKCILLGFTAKQIGQELGISYRTVESHIAKIKQKLQCSHKNDIINVCIQNGLTLLINQFNPAIDS